MGGEPVEMGGGLWAGNTNPPVGALGTLVVVPDAQTRHLYRFGEVDGECVLLSLSERHQPHVFITHCDVHTVY